MTVGIYSITSPSNKVYIGLSRNIEVRWSKYKTLACKNQPGIYNSLLKYGAEAHIFKIEQKVDISKLDKEQGNDLLNQLEVFGEEKYKEEGYILLNSLPCGRCFGELPQETKNKIKEATTGEKNHFYGRTHTEETKRKISKAKKGKKLNLTKEQREKMRQRGKQKNITEAGKEKLREANLGSNNPNYGKKASKETRRKMSEAHKGEKNYFYNNPQKGKAHGRYDSTIYYFYNKELDLHRALTKFEFRQQYNLSTTEVSGLVNGKRKQAQGWVFIQ